MLQDETIIEQRSSYELAHFWFVLTRALLFSRAFLPLLSLPTRYTCQLILFLYTIIPFLVWKETGTIDSMAYKSM